MRRGGVGPGGAIDPELLRTRWLSGASIAATAVTRLAGAMSAMTEPVALVLDHLEQVSSQDCRDAVAELALHLPVGSQLAIATRNAPPLPMGRLRAAGEIVEVGVRRPGHGWGRGARPA